MIFRRIWELAILISAHGWMSLRNALDRGIRCETGVRFRGLAIVDCRNGGRVSIGRGTIINSRNYGYHLNMFAPCKLMADRPGAMLEIGSNCRIHGTAIHAQAKIRIGDNCLIAANTQILDGNGHDTSMGNPDNRVNTIGAASPVVIGNAVWIGTGVIVLPGASIGDGAVIAAGAVVKGHIPPRSVAAGNPAVVIKSYQMSAASPADGGA